MTSPWMHASAAVNRYLFQGDEAARAAVGATWNLTLSKVACRAAINGSRAALWLGPEEYLLIDSDPSANDSFTQLLELQGLHACSIVDVSHRQLAWQITGPWAEIILSGACPLDLDALHFPVGMCTRTVLAKAEVILWRKEADVFHLEAWRSYSSYVTGLLNEIAAGYDGP